ncbi:MAG: DNA repair protein RecN [Halanaerobiaceae bacterium]|nr:DNA repair protein RecN [Halanaerobiaceae bacterium]
MLVDFRIKNFALIDELEINFSKGLNVLTGETGAGKSIIIGALEILLGGRAASDLIRKGKESAYIEATFVPRRIEEINQYLSEFGIEADPEMVLLSREIRQNGNNRNRINGQLATANMIKEISKYLVDIHGQHEHQRLLDSSSQLALLDEFIAYEDLGLRSRVRKLYKRLAEIEQKLSEYDIDEAEKAREMDLLEFQIAEIEAAQLKDNEIEEIYRDYKIMTNSEDIYAAVGNICSALKGDDYNDTAGIIDQFSNFVKALEKYKDCDESLDKYTEIISDIYYQMEDLYNSLSSYHEKLEFDEEKMDRIEKRLAIITGLQKKYGNSVDEIRAYQEEMQKRFELLKSQDKMVQKLTDEKQEILEQYFREAWKLSKIRKEKSVELEKIIAEELADLGMENTEFKIYFSEKEPAIDGIDRVEFLISPNPGEDLKPLNRIASGGELSRIMLALKTIIAHIDQVDTLVFDEVDSGVGGKVGQMMAEKLAIIGKKRQVLCITHLAQIASMADNHLYIEKEQKGNRTYTRVHILDEEERKQELARMIGVEMTDTTMKHAEEVLHMAGSKKENLL